MASTLRARVWGLCGNTAWCPVLRYPPPPPPPRGPPASPTSSPLAGPGGSTRLTSHLKGFSPECCKECTLSDMLRLNDFPQVSHVKGMSFVCAATQNAPYSKQVHPKAQTEKDRCLVARASCHRSFLLSHLWGGDGNAPKRKTNGSAERNLGVDGGAVQPGDASCRRVAFSSNTSKVTEIRGPRNRPDPEHNTHRRRRENCRCERKADKTYRPCVSAREPWYRTSSRRSHRKTSSLRIHGQSWYAHEGTRVSWMICYRKHTEQDK